MARFLAFVLLLSGAAHAVELEALSTCHTVERGRPIDVREQFAFTDRQMYLWLRVVDADVIELRWHRDDQFIVNDRLRATGKRWTTWVRRRFRHGDTGRWRVEVLADKVVLGEARFVVGDAAPAPAVAATVPSTTAAWAPLAPSADTDGCRALLNLRTSPADAPPTYAVADVRFGSMASIEHTPGLIFDDGNALHALTVRRRTHAARAWDELMSLPLRGEPTVRRWKRVPGAQPLPAPGRLHEDNGLQIVSVLGPYIGLHARLTGSLNGEAFDNSRFITVDARGALVDLRQVVGAGLEIMVGRTEDAAAFDYRRIALAPEAGLIAYFGETRIPLFSAPPRLRPFSPDKAGEYHHGRCAVKLAGHRVAASLDGAPFREVRAKALLPYSMLGVIWLDPNGPPVILPAERAQQRFALHP